MIKTAATAALALLMGTCHPTDEPKPTEPAPVVVRHETDQSPFNMETGQRLDLEMVPDAGWVQRCHDFGGQPSTSEPTLCVGVDF